MLSKEEFEEKIKKIGTIEDDVERRNLLAEITTGVSEIFETDTNLTTENEQLKNDNETLRKANMDLFLQVGTTKTTTEQTKDETGIKEEEEPQKRKFEDLFDGKGGLK